MISYLRETALQGAL